MSNTHSTSDIIDTANTTRNNNFVFNNGTDNGGDVVIISSDNVRLHCHKEVISKASKSFEQVITRLDNTRVIVNNMSMPIRYEIRSPISAKILLNIINKMYDKNYQVNNLTPIEIIDYVNHVYNIHAKNINIFLSKDIVDSFNDQLTLNNINDVCNKIIRCDRFTGLRQSASLFKFKIITEKNDESRCNEIKQFFENCTTENISVNWIEWARRMITKLSENSVVRLLCEDLDHSEVKNMIQNKEHYSQFKENIEKQFDRYNNLIEKLIKDRNHVIELLDAVNEAYYEHGKFENNDNENDCSDIQPKQKKAKTTK